MSKEVAKNEERMPRFVPASDIVEKEDGFHILMDMPGTPKENLVIDLSKNELTVSGKAAYPPDPANTGGDRKYTHVEFGGAEFRRTFTLSDAVDREKVSAKFENGVLNLFLPKAEEAKPRKIEIQAG